MRQLFASGGQSIAWSRGGAKIGQPRPRDTPGLPSGVEIRGLGRGRAPGAPGAGSRWAGQGRGKEGRGRAWLGARELTSSAAAESIRAASCGFYAIQVLRAFLSFLMTTREIR